jgi:hypothetical protein
MKVALTGAADTRPDLHPAPRRALTNVTPEADPSLTASSARAPTCRPELNVLQAVSSEQGAIGSRSDSAFCSNGTSRGLCRADQPPRPAARELPPGAHHLALISTAFKLDRALGA